MKGKYLFIIISLLFLLTIIFSFNKITGNIVKNRGKCIDSDKTSFYLYKNEQSFYTKGNTTYENLKVVYEDYCVRGAKLKEYYCDHASIIRSARRGCPKGCKDG